MTLRKIALGIGIAIVVAIVVVLLTQHGLITKIPWFGGKHVVWRNVEFITTELRFGVNYTMICTIHKGLNFYCQDNVIRDVAVPGSAFRILACVSRPAEVNINARCGGINLNLPGCYNVTLYIYRDYVLFVILYKNRTGTYRYVYKIKCGYCTDKDLEALFEPCPSAKPTKTLAIVLDVPAMKTDFKNGKIYRVNYTIAYAWAIVYKIR
ncbi:MAG: hypothetical protein GXO26_05165 [Crenarchaeota archaeon]|nr:hypothetical protein [Thermoproteota archaeon]